MTLNVNSALLLIIIFQFLFIAIFLFTNNKGKKISNILLGLLCLAMCLNLGEMLLAMVGRFDLIGMLSMLDLALILCFGPLALLYCKSIIYRDFVFDRRSLLHFIPFVVVAVLVVINAINTPPEVEVELMKQLSEFKLTLGQALIVVPFFIHMFIYVFLAYNEVKTYKSVIKENYSEGEVNTAWLTFLFRSFLVIILVSLSLSIIPYTPLREFSEWLMVLFILLVFYLVSTIMFKAMKEPALFSGINQSEIKKKYVGSKLSMDQKIKLTNNLNNLMEIDKFFLDPGLSLKQLAERLNVRSRDLSQVINEQIGTPFHDYINSLRIKHAQGLIQHSDPKLTFLEILYQSGFNSKSSFNTAFKKHAGMTPSDYRKLLSKK